MRILFLTPQLPYPAISGGLIKSLKMIEFLKSRHDIEIGFFHKDDSKKGESDLAVFKSMFPGKTFHVKHNKDRTAANFIKSLLSDLPMSVYRNFNEDFKKKCVEKARTCDLIFVDHFLMFQYVPEEWKKKIILHEHNSEFLMWERYGDTQSNPLKKLLIRFEASRIKRYEKCIIERATTILASSNDIDVLSKITSQKIDFVETLHLGDENLLERAPLIFNQTKKTMLYIGTLTWEANREGLYWFLKNVWPSVKEKHPDLHFDIIGKNNDPSLFEDWINDRQIRWHGFVENLNQFYDDARVSVAPLNFGSGIKVKVINALYRGLPMVTTTIGVEGLKLTNGHDIFFSDEAFRQSEAISTLVTDQSAWDKISTNSREIANRLYSWEGVLLKINEAVLK